MIANRRQQGFSLLELLVSLLVFSIGLLGIAGLQIVSKQSSYESQQRTIASLVAYGILEDMRTNGSGITSFVAAPDLGGGKLGQQPAANCRDASVPCSPAQKAAYDLWYWESTVDGAQEAGVEGNAGGVLMPTICIDGPGGGVAGMYTVSVAWRGAVETSNPDLSQCGAGTGQYGDGDAFRRVLTVATFIDPNI